MKSVRLPVLLVATRDLLSQAESCYTFYCPASKVLVDMTQVWLIRHGESEANAGLPTVNPAATPLTQQGHWQAQQIAQALLPPDLIVTSPYQRTQQTAQPSRDRFPNVPHLEWPVQEFTYLAPIRYKNTTIDDRRPLSDRYWQKNDPLHVDGDGAESFTHLMQRVQITYEKIQQSEADFIAIFSHGRFIRAMLWASLNQTLDTTPKLERTPKQMKQFFAFINSFKVPNGSILKLQTQEADIWFSGIHTTHLASPIPSRSDSE